MASNRAWMYRQPRVWETFLSGINGFLAQAEADMRNWGVSTMYCPCVDCINQKKFGQWDNIFHHLITHGFKLKALMKGQGDAMLKPLIKVKRVHNDLTH